MAQADNDLFSQLTQLAAAQIRMDGKLDNIMGSLQRLEANHHDHELRLRLVEAAYTTRVALRETEEALNRKIKEVSDKPTVSPGTLWKVVGLITTVAGLLWGVIAFLLNLILR